MTVENALRADRRIDALGLLRRDDGCLLLEHGHDSRTGVSFYRPPGGGVEFGEYAADALRREFMEELGIAVDVGARRAVLENIFVYEGVSCHELVFIHDVVPCDAGFYAVAAPLRLDNGCSPLCWRRPQEILREGMALYPAGLPQLFAE